MAKRRHKQEKQESPKTYNIKMPVYTTSMMEQEDGLFGKATYQDMISLLKDRLKSFSSPISTEKKARKPEGPLLHGSCNLLGIAPYVYFNTILPRLHANITKEEYESLLPYRIAEELKK